MRKLILAFTLLISLASNAQIYPMPYGGKTTHLMPYASGKIGFGTSTPSAAFDFVSTTGGFLFPRMTSTQRDAISSPSTSTIIRNTTTNLYEYYDGDSWEVLGGGFDSLQAMYDDDPTKLDVTSGTETITIRPEAVTMTNSFDGTTTVEAGQMSVAVDDRITVISEELVSISDTTTGEVVYTDVIRGLGFENGAGKDAQIHADNVTTAEVYQLPTEGGVFANSVQIGATNIPADDAGVIDLTGEIPAAITIDSVPTDGSTNAVESNGVFDALATKQATLVSGTNIKTVNGTTLLGSGDLTVTAPATKSFRVSAGDKVQAYGDSYSTGAGATVASLGWSFLTFSRLGLNRDSQAGSGSGVVEMFKRINAASIRATVRNTYKAIILSGFNDHLRGGADSRELAKIENTYKAMFASFYADVALPANSGSITQTGTWTANTPTLFPIKATTLGGQGLTNATINDKLSYTFTGTTLIIGYICNDATATGVTYSSFDVKIDGVVVQTVNTNNQSLAVSDSYWGNEYAPSAVVFKNLANVAHTVEIINKANNTLYIDYLGHLLPPSSAADILVGTIPYIEAAGYATYPTYSPTKITSDLASNAIRNAVAYFSDYPISIFDSNTGYLSSMVSGDNIHPNDSGHANIANNAMSAIVGNSMAPFISSATEEANPKVMFGANARLNNGTETQLKSGINSEVIVMDSATGSTSAFSFKQANTSGVFTSLLDILKTGNVGIGIGIPTSLLHVNGTANIAGVLTLGSTVASDINITKATPKLILTNTSVTMSGSFTPTGTATLMRMLLRPETATKVGAMYVSPNGSPSHISGYTSAIELFGTDYGASTTNFSSMSLRSGTTGLGGIYNTNAGSGVLQPFNIGMNTTSYFLMSTAGDCSFTNPLTVPNATAAGHAVRKDQIKAGTLSKTANYTVLISDFGINGILNLFVDATAGAVTITLPSAATMAGYSIKVIKTDASANAVILDGNASENINGATTHSLTAQYNTATLQSNGTQLYIM